MKLLTGEVLDPMVECLEFYTCYWSTRWQSIVLLYTTIFKYKVQVYKQWMQWSLSIMDTLGTT